MKENSLLHNVDWWDSVFWEICTYKETKRGFLKLCYIKLFNSCSATFNDESKTNTASFKLGSSVSVRNLKA